MFGVKYYVNASRSLKCYLMFFHCGNHEQIYHLVICSGLGISFSSLSFSHDPPGRTFAFYQCEPSVVWNGNTTDTQGDRRNHVCNFDASSDERTRAEYTHPSSHEPSPSLACNVRDTSWTSQCKNLAVTVLTVDMSSSTNDTMYSDSSVLASGIVGKREKGKKGKKENEGGGEGWGVVFFWFFVYFRGKKLCCVLCTR